MSLDKLNINDTAVAKCVVTERIIEQYGYLSGDLNPIHFDDDYAMKNGFKKRIAHGLICLGMISNLIGNTLPGPGSIFLDEKLKYVSPVYVGDVITATVTINKIKKLVAEVGFCCKNQDNNTVLEGTTNVLLKEVEGN